MLKKAIIIPVFNERHTIECLLKDILGLGLKNLLIFIVDDGSGDGTAEILDRLASRHRCIEVLHRQGRRGRGAAIKAGFAAALKKGCDYILEMDGDYSHRAEDIPSFFQAIESADVVIGSRRVKGGRNLRKIWARNMFSTCATFLLRKTLGLHVKDCTSGFRCFKLETLKLIPFERLKSISPVILEEMLLICQRNQKKIEEIPITFLDRKGGRSKLGPKTIAASLIDLFKVKLTYP